MELAWLEDFLALSATLNFSRAAEARNLTQPAFSRRIKNLEFWLGTTLVDRSTFPATLTPEGIAFRSKAEEVVQSLYRARDECQGQARLMRTFVSFAALHTIALSFFPAWICGIEAKMGPLRTRMMADNLHDCVQALVSRGCDLLMCYSHPAGPILLDGERYPSLTLSAERMVPMSAPDESGQPLFNLDAPAASPLPLLAYSGDTYLGKMVDLAIGDRREAPAFDVCYENSMADALKSMAVEGQGLAWLPESSARRDLADGRLVRAGGGRWVVGMDIRLYRAADQGRPEVERLWSFISRTLEGGAGQAAGRNRRLGGRGL